MNADKILKAAADKYRLSDPMPPDVRAAMEKSRKENLIRILKQEARSPLFISAVVSFFISIKKFGVSVSIAKSAVIVTTALIIGAAMITAAGIYTVKKGIDYIQYHKADSVKKEDVAAGKAIVPSVQETLFYTVAVSPVEMDDVSGEVLVKYRNKVIQELRNLHGAGAAISVEKLDRYHRADKILLLSIIRLKEKTQKTGEKIPCRISAKIINTANSRVLMYSSVTAESEDDISASLRELAEKITVKF